MNAPAMNSAVTALRFFFNHTVDRPDLASKLIRLRYLCKLPVVLNPDEVGRLIAATNPTAQKHFKQFRRCDPVDSGHSVKV